MMRWLPLLGLVAISCSGDSCIEVTPIPNGAPPAQVSPNAVQIRVSQSGLATLIADPVALFAEIDGSASGMLSLNVPAQCGGSTPICCPAGVPQATCGPLDLDVAQRAGDLPRIEIHPASGASRLDLVIRARLKSRMDIPIGVPIVGDCGAAFDSAPGVSQDITINASIHFLPDGATTRIALGTVTIASLTTDDIHLTGGFGCTLANFGLGAFSSLLTDQLSSAIQTALDDHACKVCPSGDIAECGSSLATACTDGVCRNAADACVQELGIHGRVGASAGIDLYEVAGGYATTNNNGLAVGLLGGVEPSGQPRDRCGPPAVAPVPVTIPQSAYFEGNTLPDGATPFDVALGIHASQLEQFAYASYEGGLLCPTLENAQLTSDSVSIVSRSLGRLVAENAPMAIGIRPQSPPVVTLGANTFAEGMLVEPALDVRFSRMEIDFFASIDDQWVRTFTVVADVHMPIGLQTGSIGQLVPVIADTTDAFTNITVENSDAVGEPPDELAARMPAILALVLPQVANRLAPIALSPIAGYQLDARSVTSVESNSFLAIFANMVAVEAAPVETRVAIGTIDGASVTLDLGDATEYEWSWQIDDGTWSAWSRDSHPRISTRVFSLAGTHHLDVRARRIGHPETIDTSPVRIAVPFEAPIDDAGCSSGGESPFACAFALLLIVGRRRGRRSHLTRRSDPT